MPKKHDKTQQPGSSTPLSDGLERCRIAMGQARTPAYGDAMRLCRKLERQLQAALTKQSSASAR